MFILTPTTFLALYFFFKWYNKPKNIDFWDDVVYFKASEFDQKGDLGSGRKYMQKVQVLLLDKARKLAGVPFIINSAYRSIIYNLKVKGVKDSAHTVGLAVDVRFRNESEFLRIYDALVEVGFVRIGLYMTGKNKGFIHCDTSVILPQTQWFRVNKKRVTLIEFKNSFV